MMQQVRKRQILIPQFSLRWLLAVMTASAAVFSVFGLAVRGNAWATGVSIAIVSLAIVLLIHALVFALVWFYSLVTSAARGPSSAAGRSPFLQVQASGPTQPQVGSPTSEDDAPATPIILE